MNASSIIFFRFRGKNSLLLPINVIATKVVGFYKGLRDSKSSQMSRTLLSILTDLSSAEVSTVFSLIFLLSSRLEFSNCIS